MPRRGLREWLAGLGASTEQLTAADRRRVADEAGADRVADCVDRSRVRLRGTIEVLSVRPHANVPWLEAELSDGTGTVTLVWMGRREIPGIEAGRDLVVEGRISDVDGQCRIYNPYYTLL